MQCREGLCRQSVSWCLALSRPGHSLTPARDAEAHAVTREAWCLAAPEQNLPTGICLQPVHRVGQATSAGQPAGRNCTWRLRSLALHRRHQ